MSRKSLHKYGNNQMNVKLLNKSNKKKQARRAKVELLQYLISKTY